MRDLSGRPSKLKYDHEGHEIDQLCRLVSIGAPNTAKEDEWEGGDDAESANQVPALAFSVSETADQGY